MILRIALLTLAVCFLIPAASPLLAQRASQPPAQPTPDDRPAAMRSALKALATQPASTGPSSRPADRSFGPGGFNGFGPGGFGGPERKLVKEFDKDDNGWLDRTERDAARAVLRAERSSRRRSGPFNFGPGGGDPTSRPATTPSSTSRPAGPGSDLFQDGPGGPGGPFGRRPNRPQPQSGPRISPGDVRAYPDSSLYEPSVVRTFFLDFEHPDWESELVDFYRTDIELPATVMVDGQRFDQVGARFRGTTSFNTVQDGYKRSFKLKLNSIRKKQELYGHQTINLNNATLDPGFLHSIIYSHIARRYIPTPRVNYARLVINGEYWGVFVNSQQVDKEFLKEAFGSSRGVRWKAPGNRFATAAFSYLGEEVEPYKQFYDMKTDDGQKAWKDLINLCRVLNQTPSDQLEAALKDILDVDGALWFLALENVFINTDGYWSKGSDFNLFRDKKGKFHLIPHDMNESFEPPGFGGMPFNRAPGAPPLAMAATRPFPADGRDAGPGSSIRPATQPSGVPPQFRMRGPRGPEVRGVELDPLVGIENHDKPLRSRLLAVPALRERYLRNVRTLAEDWLDWKKLGPVAEEFQALVEQDVRQDTRKLFSYAEFKSALAATTQPATSPTDRRQSMSLRAFLDQRRTYLLNHPEIKKLPPSGSDASAASSARTQ